MARRRWNSVRSCRRALRKATRDRMRWIYRHERAGEMKPSDQRRAQAEGLRIERRRV